MKNDPLKKVENYRGWKYLHRLTAGQAVLFVAMIFILLPCPCSRPHVHFFIHNSLFSTTSDSRWWPNAPRHNCGGEFFYFYLCGVNDEAALQSRAEAEERNPSLLPSAWFPCRKLHQRHNYLHSRSTIWNTISPSDSVGAATCTVHRRTKCRKCASCRFPSRGRGGNNW